MADLRITSEAVKRFSQVLFLCGRKPCGDTVMDLI